MGEASTTSAKRVALAVLLTLGVALFGARVARAADGVNSIDVLSNRADLISGNDALVAVRLAAGSDPAGVRGIPPLHLSPGRAGGPRSA